MKSVLSMLLLSIALPAYAQQPDAFSGLADEADIGKRSSRAERPNAGLAPLTSRFLLNGVQVNMGDTWIVNGDLLSGLNRETVLDGDITRVLRTKSDRRLAFRNGGSVYEQEQSSWVFQLRSMEHKRRITTSRLEGGELIGFNLDFSITGKCFLPDADPDSYCTYTPGVSTIPGEYDPDTLFPTNLLISTEFGQEITEAAHLSLQELVDGEEVFQRGDEDNPIGLSFDIPNAGFAGIEGGVAKGSRNEWADRRYVPTLSKVDQRLVSGPKDAAASRTVRAFVLAEPQEYDHRAVLMQLAAWVLPEAPLSVTAAPDAPRTSVSNNLFHALDNAWTPSNSFTLFQTGRAYLVHSETAPRRAADTPFANYFGMWLGLTAVRDTSISMRQQFVPTGDRISVAGPEFREGGLGTPFADLIDAGVTIFDPETLELTDVDFINIDDLFIQVGLDVSTQEALRRVTTTETSRYRLAPHLSFNGNITGGEHVFRYYAGAILTPNPNGYVGADYTLNTESGWNGYARVELYSNPDRDYFSQAELRASRTFTLSEDRAFTLGLGGVTAIDARKDRSEGGSRFALGEGDSHIDFVGRWREGPLDLTLRHRWANDDGLDWAESTTVGVGYAASNRFFISAQVTPTSDEESYIESTLSMNWRLAETSNAPAISMQYSRAKYDLGSSSSGARLTDSEDIFQLGFSAKF